MISIITINYRNVKATSELLDSIKEVGFGGEVIVVDNSNEAVKEENLSEARILKKNYPWAKVIESPRNLGFAGGNNLALRHAKGDMIFFLNNDTILETDPSSEIEKFFHAHPRAAGFSPKILFRLDHRIQYAGSTPLHRLTLRNRTVGYGEKDQGQYDLASRTPYLHGAAMAVRMEAIRDVGCMDEGYFLYYEEIDWSIQFTGAGWDLWYNPDMMIFHHGSLSVGKDSPLKRRYMRRNRLRLARRWFSLWAVVYVWMRNVFV